MFRFRHAALLAVSVGILVSSARAADTSGDYWPFKKGATWYYNSRVNGQHNQMTMRVANVQTVGDRTVAQLEALTGGKISATEYLGKSDEGYMRLRMDRHDLKPPLLVLRLPVHDGDTWMFDSKMGFDRVRGRAVVDLEPVTVPAGSFRAAVVTLEADLPEGKYINKQWLVPGMGLVRQHLQLPKMSVILELVRFEPGG